MTSARIKMLFLMLVSMFSMGMADALREDCTSIVKVLLQNSHTGATHAVGDANAVPVPNLFGRAVRPDDGWTTITTTETSCTPHAPMATASSTVDFVVVPIVSTPVISHTSTVTTSYTTTLLETGTVPTTSVHVSTSAPASTEVISTVVPVVTSSHVSSTTEVTTLSSKSITFKVTSTVPEVTTRSSTSSLSISLATVVATTSTASVKPVTSSLASSAESASASATGTEVASTVTGKSTDFLTEPCPTASESAPSAGKVTGAPAPTLVTTEIVYTITVPCSHTEKCGSTEVYSTSTLVLSKPTGTHITAPAPGKITGVPIPGSTVTGETTDSVTEPCPTDTELAPTIGTVIAVPVPVSTDVAPTPVTTEIIFTITVPCSHTEKCGSTEVYSTSTLVFSNPTGTHITAPTAPAVGIVPAPVTSELPPAPVVTEITVTVDIPCTESTKCVSTKVVTTALSVSVVPVVPIAVTVPSPETSKVAVPAPAPAAETSNPPQVKVSVSVPETIITTYTAPAHTTLATVPQAPVPKGSDVPQQVPHPAPHNGETQIIAPTVPHPASSETQVPTAPVFNGANAAGLIDGRLLTMSLFVLAHVAHLVIL